MDLALAWYSAWAGADPDFPALVLPTGGLSYGVLRDRIEDERRRLAGAGLNPGDRVVVDVADPEAWVVALLATLAAGAQAILPDSDWSPSRRRRALATLSPGFLLRLGKKGALHLVRSSEDAIHGDLPAGAGVWLFTSGTTATPVPHFRDAAVLRRMVERVRARWPATFAGSRPAVLSTAPLAHSFGLVNSLLLTHAIGGTLIQSDADDAAATVGCVFRHEARVLLAWPSHLRTLARRRLWPRPSASTLEWCVSSSYRLEPEVARRFSDCTGCAVRSQYGITETGPLCLDGANPPSTLAYCVGAPLDGVELEVVDARDEPAPPGARGQLRVRAEGVALAGAEQNAHAFWHTGDIGRIDPQGRVFVFGRAHPFTDERREIYA
jgi:acyl-coenzyme A synthetase/AMP-(fatty) acid ligase